MQFTINTYYKFLFITDSFYQELYLNLIYLHFKYLLFLIFIKDDKWKHILSKIKTATKKYEPCKGNCSCHAEVIKNDLQLWKDRGGITKKDVESGLKQSVHYQIMDHKLYREDSCLFPTR